MSKKKPHEYTSKVVDKQAMSFVTSLVTAAQGVKFYEERAELALTDEERAYATKCADDRRANVVEWVEAIVQLDRRSVSK